MSSWLQSQLKAAGDLLEAVDRTAQKVSNEQLRGPSRSDSSAAEGPPAPTASWLRPSLPRSRDQVRGSAHAMGAQAPAAPAAPRSQPGTRPSVGRPSQPLSRRSSADNASPALPQDGFHRPAPDLQQRGAGDLPTSPAQPRKQLPVNSPVKSSRFSAPDSGSTATATLHAAPLGARDVQQVDAPPPAQAADVDQPASSTSIPFRLGTPHDATAAVAAPQAEAHTRPQPLQPAAQARQQLIPKEQRTGQSAASQVPVQFEQQLSVQPGSDGRASLEDRTPKEIKVAAAAAETKQTGGTDAEQAMSTMYPAAFNTNGSKATPAPHGTDSNSSSSAAAARDAATAPEKHNAADSASPGTDAASTQPVHQPIDEASPATAGTQPAGSDSAAEAADVVPEPILDSAEATSQQSDAAAAAAVAPRVRAPAAADGAAADTRNQTSAGDAIKHIRHELDQQQAAWSAREAQLTKTVTSLRSRLEQRGGEIQQLEELLQQADARASGSTGQLKRLEDDLARAQAAKGAAEAALAAGLQRAEGEAQELRQQLLAALQKAHTAEKRALALEDARDSSLQERQESEARLVEGLREEAAAAESRLEDERRSATSVRQAAAAREAELQASLSEAAASMSSLQRALDERSSRLAAAEERASAAEAEMDSLSRDLASTQERLRRAEERASDSGLEAVSVEVESWKAASGRAQQAAAEAEARLAEADAQLRHSQAEIENLRIAAASGASSVEWERRYKEVTELLYLKQTQLEQIAAEKAAQQLTLERELAAARAEAERVRRREVVDRAAISASYAYSDDVVPMESLGGAYQRLAQHNRFGQAVKASAKFIDSSASTATRMLRQYPVTRLAVFAYLLFLHMFVYILLNRLQHRALSSAGS